MSLNSKRKGSDFERELVKILNDKVDKGHFKRIPSSGAIGTNMDEPLLTSDLSGEVEGFPKKLKIEAKVGYGGSKQFALKKEWIDKIREEASRSYAFPLLMGKFSGARTGSQIFVVLDLDDFIWLLDQVASENRIDT